MVLGSLAALGHSGSVPPRMAMSLDVDAYTRRDPARVFELGRELPEARVKALLEQVLTSPLVPRVAKEIESRLGRKLEPQDLWYAGGGAFETDTFAFPNDIRWRSAGKADLYANYCFVLARAIRQFHAAARFDPAAPTPS